MDYDSPKETPVSIDANDDIDKQIEAYTRNMNASNEPVKPEPVLNTMEAPAPNNSTIETVPVTPVDGSMTMPVIRKKR